MVDLSTRYLGMDLRNPFVPSASPLSRSLDSARELEDAGASALVMHSLFEEEIAHAEDYATRFMQDHCVGFREEDSCLPIKDGLVGELDEYLEQLTRLKAALEIPVVASLNGFSLDGWIRHGRELETAGADALELNAYYISTDTEESASMIEDRHIELLDGLRQAVSIPITMKLSSQFSSLPNFVQRLERHGAEGVSLFNRFYQPDLDLDSVQESPHLQLSNPHEARLRIRWIGILYGKVKLSLAVTGGVHNVEDVVKAILAGTDVVHLCSALLLHGPHHLHKLIRELAEWMEERGYESVEQLKGSVSQNRPIDPPAYERANYLKVLRSYR